MKHNYLSSGDVASGLNDRSAALRLMLCMTTTPRIHADKSPHRLHFIPEWAAHRGMTQAALVRATGADKGIVSRWFQGTLPSEKYIDPLVAALHLDEPAALFRHPDDDWLARLFRGRSEEERKRMLKTLETAFPPRKVG